MFVLTESDFFRLTEAALLDGSNCSGCRAVSNHGFLHPAALLPQHLRQAFVLHMLYLKKKTSLETLLHVSTPQSMILQSYQNKLIWESESTAAQICQIWNTTPEADVHVIKTFSFLSRNGSKDTEYSCSLIPVSNTSLMQRVVTDMILQNSPEYPVKHYSAFQGDSGDVCGSVLRHFLGTDGEILFPG